MNAQDILTKNEEIEKQNIVIAPRDKTSLNFENSYGFKEKSRVHAAMHKYCWDVVFNENKATDFYFYDFPDSQYGPTYRALIAYFDCYLQNPDAPVVIKIDHFKNEEDRPYKTLVLTGTLLKVNPREAANDLSQGDVKHLKMTLLDTTIETVVHEYPVPKLTLKEKLKAFWLSVKTFFMPPKPKKLPEIEKVHLEKTSYVACWTKYELENKIFEPEIAHQIIDEDLKGINDPEPKVKDFRMKAFKGL
jgi:hypothetical protein